MKATIKELLDEQRKILHDRLEKITTFDSEDERSNFIVDVMKDLPYPDYNKFNCDNGDHEFQYPAIAGKITCKHCKTQYPYG